jgi:hypothetical protein
MSTRGTGTKLAILCIAVAVVCVVVGGVQFGYEKYRDEADRAH